MPESLQLEQKHHLLIVLEQVHQLDDVRVLEVAQNLDLQLDVLRLLSQPTKSTFAYKLARHLFFVLILGGASSDLVDADTSLDNGEFAAGKKPQQKAFKMM